MEMVRDRLGPDAERPFCAACHRATGGNPLLLRELLKAMQAENIRPDAAHADAIGRGPAPRRVAHRSAAALPSAPGCRRGGARGRAAGRRCDPAGDGGAGEPR